MIKWLLTLLLTTPLIIFDPILADEEHMEARRLKEAGSILPLEQILKSVRKFQGGRILEVELEREHGRYIYEVELLEENGRVQKMEIDAVSGELLKTKRKD